MAKPKAVQLYLDYIDNFEFLTDEQTGKLIKAILKYANDGIMPELDQVLMVAFMPIKKQMAKDFEKYAKKCETNTVNGRKGGRKKPKETQNNRTVNSETQKSQYKEEYKDKEEEDITTNVVITGACDEEKEEYAENVKLSPSQYSKLVEKYGSGVTNKAIDVLSAYKCSNGKKYKSDYHAILSWAIGRAEEKNKSSTDVFAEYL